VKQFLKLTAMGEGGEFVGKVILFGAISSYTEGLFTV